MTKRVAVTGSSGLIGGALRRSLGARGDEVVRLVRRPVAAPGEVSWDPAQGRLDPGALEGVDAVVNLAGAGVGDHRWTASHKRRILRSRVDSTETVSRALAEAARATGATPRLISSSGVDLYGDRGDEVLTEDSGGGPGFLADVVRAWESATAPAAEAGLPVVHLRTGLVMAPEGGAFEPLLRLARLGLAGPLGSGRQWWPWITLHDVVRVILHVIDGPDRTGPVNMVAPGVARQRDIAAELGRQLHRPAVLPAPAIALRVVVGEFSESILASHRIHPDRLTQWGFAFDHAELPEAVSWLLSPGPR